MAIAKRIVFLTYDGAELLDVTGPATVFATATQIEPATAYECLTASVDGGLVQHSCGIGVDTKLISEIRFRSTDTFLVAGALQRPLLCAMNNERIQKAVRRAAKICERYGSICTGGFVLAATGLLEGKSLATHWAANTRMEKFSANSTVNPDALYVQDGRLWTSAGVTTGIDMALAMLETDYGPVIKAKVAKQLVVYAHRPGHQAQFSDVLAAQIRVDEHYAGLVDWLMNRLDKPTRVGDMASFVGMSERSFHRKFTALFAMPPGKFLENLKLDHARVLIEAGEAVTVAGNRVGFLSPSAFRIAFKDKFGVTPRHHREMQVANSN
jgi:transcriptional regulator GlxA family with amidase domain